MVFRRFCHVQLVIWVRIICLNLYELICFGVNLIRPREAFLVTEPVDFEFGIE